VPVLGPQLDLEEAAAVGEEGIVGGQPASLNRSLLAAKRDRKIAASIGSSKQ
jgi:hypothetical protein